MFFDPRVRVQERGRGKARTEKRDEQEIMATSSKRDVAAIGDGDSDSSDDIKGTSISDESQAQPQYPEADSPPAPFSPLSSRDVPGTPVETPDPTPTHTPCTSSSSASAQSTDFGSEISPIANMLSESTTADDDDLQSTMSGSSSLNPQPSSTSSEDLRTAAVSDSWTTSTAQNTWITATSDEASSSDITIVPLPTFVGPASMPFAADSTTADTLSPPTSDSFSSVPHTSTAISSATSVAAVLPNLKPSETATSIMTARTIAGVTTGVIVIVLLVSLCVFAYLRGGTLRGLGPSGPLSAFNPSRKTPAVNESQENFFRRETSETRPRDLEKNTTVTSGSHYDDQEEWKEVDVHDARSGIMDKDNGEWLESWRRGKEKMMTTRRPPELHFNPDLPLPPINWEGTKR